MKLNRYFFSKRTIGILFCILLAALTWLVGKLSKEATQQYTIKLRYMEVPTERFVEMEASPTIKVKLRGVGFSLFKYTFSPPVVSLSVHKLKKVGKDKYVFTENLKQQLNRQYFPDVRIEEIQPDTIKIYLKKIKQKKVPVRLQFSGTLQEDYQVDSYKVFPDSVIVSGLAADLDTITGVYLQKKYKRNVTASYSGEIRITDTPKLHYDTDKVTFSLQMVHVTEQEIKAKVQLIHQPFSVEVKLFPEEVPLLLTGDVETIRNLKPTDITIVADYNQRKDRYIPLEVRKKPASLNVNFTEQKEVEYLIIHE
ncbi:CdaR family protein [Capnocytophaga gingivalis]|uniref:CdaR family protein n=1 Tax=Capnocytophaga gingivalis TaxID=1017 RepID=UPI0028E681E0|nr:CdaR family protein [Capnocytophaga gingivalis]